jgi:hypothetical protein
MEERRLSGGLQPRSTYQRRTVAALSVQPRPSRSASSDSAAASASSKAAKCVAQLCRRRRRPPDTGAMRLRVRPAARQQMIFSCPCSQGDAVRVESSAPCVVHVHPPEVSRARPADDLSLVSGGAHKAANDLGISIPHHRTAAGARTGLIGSMQAITWTESASERTREATLGGRS